MCLRKIQGQARLLSSHIGAWWNSSPEWIVRRTIGPASDLVVGYGGSLSGEHGDGQARGELLPRMFDDEMFEAFREFKSIWDPDWKMNPGK